MTKQDFCYWLNGYFELRLEKGPLKPSQVGIVRNHLNLVKKVERRGLSGFCAWMEVILDLLAESNDECDEKTQNLIYKKLGETFKHEIDGTYDGDQDDLNSIHHGGRSLSRRNDVSVLNGPTADSAQTD
jgi:hypothetical protein